MAITPKPPGSIDTPNTLTPDSVGAIDVPNVIPAEAAGQVAIPNTLNAEAVIPIAVPNVLSAEAAGAVGVPNTLTPETAGIVAIPNVIPAETPAAFPRTLTPLVDINFTLGCYAQAGTPILFDDLFTYTRASTATFINRTAKPTGGYDYFVDTAAINALRFEFDSETDESLGALIEGGSTNLSTWSEDISNTGWTEVNSGTGIAPVVTLNHALAPDKVMTADRVQLDLNGGTSSGDASRMNKTVTTTADGFMSIWMKSLSGNVDIALSWVGALNTVQVTSEWKRFDGSTSGFIGAGNVRLGLVGNQSTSDTADILVWGLQVEELPFASSYIKTEGSTVSRSSDDLKIDVIDNYPLSGNVTTVCNFDFISKDRAGVSSGFQVSPISGGSKVRIETSGIVSGQHGVNLIAALTSGEYGLSVDFTQVFKSSTNILDVYVSGIIEGSGDAGGIFVADSAADIGLGMDSGSGSHIYGHVSKFATYEQALTAQEVGLL